jgi:hypothetical protein
MGLLTHYVAYQMGEDSGKASCQPTTEVRYIDVPKEVCMKYETIYEDASIDLMLMIALISVSVGFIIGKIITEPTP